MNTIIDIDIMKINLKIKYLNNLLNICNKQGIDKNKINNLLNNLINNEQNDLITSIENNIKTENIQTITETDINTTIVSDKNDYLYLKPWTKLTIIHKIIKLKEYVNSLNIDNDKDKQELKDKLIDLIKNKNLLKKNKINYDFSKGKIISISCLKYDNDKYIVNYEL
jgi:hypothetical protein